MLCLKEGELTGVWFLSLLCVLVLQFVAIEVDDEIELDGVVRLDGIPSPAKVSEGGTALARLAPQVSPYLVVDGFVYHIVGEKSVVLVIDTTGNLANVHPFSSCLKQQVDDVFVVFVLHIFLQR